VDRIVAPIVSSMPSLGDGNDWTEDRAPAEPPPVPRRGQKGSAFLSYSSKDRKSPQFAALVDDLRNLEWDLWSDQRLPGARQWWEDILTHIRLCQLVVSVVTEKSLRSEACQRELSYAMALRRPVLAVSLSPISLEELPSYLRPWEIIDYSGRSLPAEAGNCVAKLAITISELEKSGVPSLPDPLPQPPPMPPFFTEELAKYVGASELSLDDQYDMLGKATRLVNDDEDDRLQLKGTVDKLLLRDDISWKVRPQLEDLGKRLESGVHEEGPQTRELPQRDAGGRIQLRSFRAPGLDCWKLVKQLERWLESEGMKTADHRVRGGYVIECSPAKTTTRMIGSGAWRTITLTLKADKLDVELSNPRWKDKERVPSCVEFG